MFRFSVVVVVALALAAVVGESGRTATLFAADLSAAAASCAEFAVTPTPPIQASPTSLPAVSAPASDDTSWLVLWPCGLFVGYISMILKRQIQRRGYPFGDRRQAFGDFISVQPSNPPTPPETAAGTNGRSATLR